MKTVMEVVLSGIFGIYLLRAAVEDWRTQLVRRYLWWIAGGAGLCLLLLRRGWDLTLMTELLAYGALQFHGFSRAYGKADCHAFFTCGILLMAYGGSLKTCLWHMLFTFTLLGALQLWRGNVNRRGNLDRPVALIPYLGLGFVVTILLRWLFGGTF
ncbi:MAG: hypothetical protein IKS85_09430 [Lachnospiraceae bacterium]|nr:hypothetical protein [Lachnospiraceae bacterium]